MEGPFPGKRPSDSSEPATPAANRRRLSSSSSSKHPHAPWKSASTDTLFRILCPGDRTGGVIGKGGSIIRQVREETSARIRIEDLVPGSDDRVILILGERKEDEVAAVGEGEDDGVSPAQRALVRVFERILRLEEEEKEVVQGPVVCRLLAFSSQVGCVLGKGGKIVEKIRQESGAQIRVLGRDQVPICAGTGDELIHISGSFLAVKKALLSVSSCLQDNPKTDPASLTTSKSCGATVHGNLPTVDRFTQRSTVSGIHSQDYHARGFPANPVVDIIASDQRRLFEEEVNFRILCSNEKVGSIIGKGGVIVRALQSETGASIKVIDAAPDCEERVILISAHESSESRHSPTQDAILRVHARLTEAGAEKCSARLLVPSQQIGCLLGRGGNIIAEMRRSTGATIRIFLREHVPKFAQPNDEVVQATGSFQSVQEALLHITSRIRETIFPMKTHASNTGPYLSSQLDIPPPALRTVNEPESPGADRLCLSSADRSSLLYGSEMSGHISAYDQSSPRSWASRAGSSCNIRGNTDPATSMGSKGIPSATAGSGSQSVMTNTTVEVVVPQQYLGFVYGENNSNLADIKELSGASVTIHDPKPGAAEGLVVISGFPDQMRTAQSLLHAFVLCGKTAA